MQQRQQRQWEDIPEEELEGRALPQRQAHKETDDGEEEVEEEEVFRTSANQGGGGEGPDDDSDDVDSSIDSEGRGGNLYDSALDNHLGLHRALVLDCAYRPINVASWPKAVMMDWTQKAEVVEYYPPPAHAFSGQGLHSLPAVIRVAAYVDLHEVSASVACTRRNILLRDKFTCQYCGSRGKDGDLTLDHVIPVSKGGKNSFLNLVTACMQCNQRKGNRLLSTLPGWKLRSVPRRPSPWEIGIVVGLGATDIARSPQEWAPYLEPYRIKIAELKKQSREAGLPSEDGEDEEGDEAMGMASGGQLQGEKMEVMKEKARQLLAGSGGRSGAEGGAGGSKQRKQDKKKVAVSSSRM